MPSYIMYIFCMSQGRAGEIIRHEIRLGQIGEIPKLSFQTFDIMGRTCFRAEIKLQLY